MMYHNKMVVAVKANGKILREFKDIVRIPFGAEYSLLIKNIHNKRAQVAVDIDGQDVLNGRAMIVNANSEAELTRFVTNLSAGNTFKFIERTAGIEEHRGIKLDDGIIRVTFKYEDTTVQDFLIGGLEGSRLYNKTVRTKSAIGTLNSPMRNMVDSNSVTYGASSSSVCYCAAPSQSEFMGSAAAMMGSVIPVSDVGITVPGSISNQQFREVTGFKTESEEHVMVLRLSGFVDGQQVIQPITVKTKPTCTSCGKVNKATAKFCTECGTSLQLV